MIKNHKHMTQRDKAVDALKGLAILAVVADHGFYLFPAFHNEILASRLFYSIPWFIFILGFMNTQTSDPRMFRTIYSVIQYYIKKTPLLLYYTGGTLITLMIFDKGISFAGVSGHLALFSAQPPYYFFNFLIQFYIVFPFLYLFIYRGKGIIRLLIVLFIGAIVLILPQLPIPWPFAADGRILFGIRFIPFLLGVAAGIRFGLRKIPVIWAFALFVPAEAAYRGWGRNDLFHIYNPWKIFWSISFLLLAYSVLRQIKGNSFLVSLLSNAGRFSLVIYTFHYAILLLFRTSSANQSLPIFTVAIIASVILPIALQKALTSWNINSQIYQFWKKRNIFLR